jgi:hypothetical protein
MDDIYKHFKTLVNDYEIMAVQQMRSRCEHSPDISRDL